MSVPPEQSPLGAACTPLASVTVPEMNAFVKMFAWEVTDPLKVAVVV